MRRPSKILLIVAASIAGLIALLIVVALIAVQTPWFRNLARGKIIAEIEKSTGGRAEVGAFSFSPFQLRAEVDNLVIHGTEGPNEPPLLRARSIVVGLKIVSLLKHEVDIDSLVITQPQAYVRVAPDGSTNLPRAKPAPAPGAPSGGGPSPVQTVLDLAVRHFRIRDGLVQFADRKTPLDLRGEKLRARLDYHLAGPSYTGTISMAPVYIESGGRPPLPVNVNLPLTIAGDRIQIAGATFDAPQSRLVLSGAVTDFSAPRGSVRLNGHFALAELARSFTSVPPEVRHAPPLELRAAAALNGNQAQLAGLQLALGRSSLDASGAITDLKALDGTFRFNGTLSLTELGRMLALSSRPQGTVRLAGGAKLAGAGNYAVAAKLDANGVAFQAGKTRLSNVSAASNIDVTPRRIALDNLRLAALGGTFTGRAEVVNRERFRLDGALNNFGLRYLARTYASRDLVWDGIISGPLHAAGGLKGSIARQLAATARLGIRPGRQGVPIAGRINLDYDGPRDAVNLGNSYIALPSSRLDLAGSLNNQLRIRLVSRNLNDFLPAVAMASSNPPKSLPIALVNGQARFDGTVSGRLSDPVIAGHAALTNFAVNQQRFDRFAADLSAAKNGASIRNAVLARGSLQGRLDASVGLKNWETTPEQPVSAKVSLQNASIGELLAMAGRPETPASGTLDAAAQVRGAIGEPGGTADVTVAKGALYGEPFNTMRARVNYANRLVTLEAEESGAGGGRIDLNAKFEHPPKQFTTGRVEFHLASSGIELQRLKSVQQRRPGLAGTIEVLVDGVGALQSVPGRPSFVPSSLKANIAARSVMLDSRPAGELLATAETRGQNLAFQLRSDLADSNIRGDGTMVLAGDYPVDARVTFSPIRLGAVRNLLANPGQQPAVNLDGVIEGVLAVAGPAMRPEDLKGSLTLPTVRLTAAPRAEAGQAARPGLALHNPAPVVIALDRSVVRIQSARLAGSSTDFSIAGAVHLRERDALDVRATGNIDLGIAQSLNPDVLASGSVLLNAAVQGRISQPAVNGRLELRNASFNMVGVPNGLSNANGVIQFGGAQALIQNLTGETGGGKISLAGTVRYGAPEMSFQLQARANQIRVRYPESISTKLNAALDLAGTTSNSLLSGSASILEVAVHSHTDFGSVLSQTAAPARAPAARTGLLGNMRLDIRIDTAPGVQFQTGLTQNLEAEAHLRVRGTPSSPGMLGAVDVTQGDVVFFGSQYTITRGRVSFFNPQRVEPILDAALETTARGVDVTLMVSGPMDHLRLTYRSDPPLQFSDIVQLLATGKMPTTDPVLAAQQPPAPEQNWQQMGASALLGQAVANPVSGRLQRLFGVTKLKIDPQIIGAENNPQARLTLQQQITRDLTFTYIQDVTQSNPQVIRIEWALDPTWSAIALRQDNGQFGVDFFYKKRFR